MAVLLSLASSLKNEAAKSDKLPNRLKILNWGENPTLKGKVIVNDRTADIFAANQAAMGRDTIVLDFEHNSVPDTAEYQENPSLRDVAAHLSCSVVRGDGVYCDVRDWTPMGQEKARNFIDLSPAPYLDKETRELVGMHSVALTQTGAVEELQFLNARENDPFQSDLVALSATVPNCYSPMNTRNIKIFRAFMGMESGTDEEVMSAMASEMEKKSITRKGPLDTAGDITPTVGQTSAMNAEAIAKLVQDQVKAIIDPLTANVTTLKASADAAVKATEKAAKDAQVQRATREGKVIPLSAATLETMSVAAITEMVDGLPKTVKFGRNPDPVLKPGATGKPTDAPKIFALNSQNQLVAMDAPQRAVPGAGLEVTRQAFQADIERLRATR